MNVVYTLPLHQSDREGEECQPTGKGKTHQNLILKPDGFISRFLCSPAIIRILPLADTHVGPYLCDPGIRRVCLFCDPLPHYTPSWVTSWSKH